MVKSQPAKNSYLSKEIESVELFLETDKLHAVQVSLERFLEKWTKKDIKELETPRHFARRRRLLNFAQWINRFALTTAGVLSLTGHSRIGGSISVFYPLVELLISFFKEKIENKNRKWGEFFKDSEGLANELDRLSSITESIRTLSLGDLNNVSEELNDKVYDFLKEYDENKNRKIEVSELKIGKFMKDLKTKWETEKESKLLKIVQAIQVLQRKATIYHRRLYVRES